jgi:hypothetical protein
MYLISLIVIIFGLLSIVYVLCPNLHIKNTVIPFYKRKDNKFPNIKYLNEINILCCSGLSNRIRTILGFLQVCNYYNKKLNVIWIQDNTCNGLFLDYFKHIDNINFVNLQKKIHYTGQSTIENICQHYKVKFDIKKLYSNIKLIDRLDKKLQVYILKNNIPNIIGLHIRRTDYTGNIIGKIINGTNSDDDFFEYIDRYSKNKNFFIATDNKETQDIYRSKYKKQTLFYSKIKKTDNLRQTSLENAIMDIFILSYCKRIKGTNNSSFTEFSINLKKLRSFSID